jgi:hypothetical protein
LSQFSSFQIYKHHRQEHGYKIEVAWVGYNDFSLDHLDHSGTQLDDHYFDNTRLIFPYLTENPLFPSNRNSVFLLLLFSNQMKKELKKKNKEAKK